MTSSQLEMYKNQEKSKGLGRADSQSSLSSSNDNNSFIMRGGNNFSGNNHVDFNYLSSESGDGEFNNV